MLALHPGSGALLVVEVKSVVPDVQAMLASLDRKVRLAPGIASERGLAHGRTFASVSRLLVLPADRTSRRRIDRHAATFARALPARTVEVRRWLNGPGRASSPAPFAGILFVSGVTAAGARHRVRSGSAAPKRGRRA